MPQVRHVDESSSGKHDCLEQEQADTLAQTIVLFQGLQELPQVEQWHVAMYILDVCAEKLIA